MKGLRLLSSIATSGRSPTSGFHFQKLNKAQTNGAKGKDVEEGFEPGARNCFALGTQCSPDENPLIQARKKQRSSFLEGFTKMIPNDEFTYKVIRNSMKALALDYGFTHAEPDAIDDLTSIVYHYLCKIVCDSKQLAEIAGKKSFNFKDVVISTTKTGIDIDALNELMTCRDSVPAPDKLSEYPVQIKGNSPSRFSDDELVERETKDIPSFLPSLRCRNKKVDKLAKEKEKEQKKDRTAARDPILKPITNVYKSAGTFDDIVERISSYPRPKYDRNITPKSDMIHRKKLTLSAQMEAVEREKQLEKEKLEKEKREREEAQRYAYQFLHTKPEEYHILSESRANEVTKEIDTPSKSEESSEHPKDKKKHKRKDKKHRKEKNHEHNEKKRKEKKDKSKKEKKEKKKKHRESNLDSSALSITAPEPLNLPQERIPSLPKEPQMPVLKPEKDHKKEKPEKPKEQKEKKNKEKEKYKEPKPKAVVSSFKIRPIPPPSEPIPPPPVLQPSVPIPINTSRAEEIPPSNTDGSEEKQKEKYKKKKTEMPALNRFNESEKEEKKKDKEKKKHKENKREGETTEEREERRRLKKEKKREKEERKRKIVGELGETPEPVPKKQKIEESPSEPPSPLKGLGLKLKILLPPKPVATSTPIPPPREPVMEKKPEPPPKSVTPISSDSSRPPSSKGSHSSKHTPEKHRDKQEGVKIMSERVQLSKALKESMETVNPRLTSSGRLVRSERRTSESNSPLKKKKRPEEKKPKSSSTQSSFETFESAPGILQIPDEQGSKDDEKYWYCPNCKIKYTEEANMICCERCNYWYHWHCVGLMVEPTESDWYCRRCLDRMAKRK